MIFSAFIYLFFLKVCFKASPHHLRRAQAFPFFHDENWSIQRKWKWTVKAPSSAEQMESEASSFFFFFYFVDVAALLFLTQHRRYRDEDWWRRRSHNLLCKSKSVNIKHPRRSGHVAYETICRQRDPDINKISAACEGAQHGAPFCFGIDAPLVSCPRYTPSQLVLPMP